MGVQGLWKILSPTSRPVTLESLDNKVLAVDVSVWLHQSVKGMRDSHGRPLANAHLIGLFNRICKLLFYHIKPIFVFDGKTPALKKQTLLKRRQQKDTASKEAKKISEKILENYVKSQVLVDALGNEKKSVILPSSSRQPDIYDLPPVPEENLSQETSEDEEDYENSNSSNAQDCEENLVELDIDSEDFLNLPTEQQHDILLELRESSKRHSWSQLDSLPEDANDFSHFQLQGILQRNKVQQRIDAVQKQLCTEASRNMLAALEEQNYHVEMETQRIVSEDAAHYILVKGNDLNKDTSNQESLERSPIKKDLKEGDILDNVLCDESAGTILDNVTDKKNETLADLNIDSDIIIHKIIQKSPRKSVIMSLNTGTENILNDSSNSVVPYKLENIDDNNVEFQKVLLESCESAKPYSATSTENPIKNISNEQIIDNNIQNLFAFDSAIPEDKATLFNDKDIKTSNEKNTPIMLDNENKNNKLNNISENLLEKAFVKFQSVNNETAGKDSWSNKNNLEINDIANTDKYKVEYSKKDNIFNIHYNEENKEIVEVKADEMNEEVKIIQKNDDRTYSKSKSIERKQVMLEEDSNITKDIKTDLHNRELFIEEGIVEESEDEFIDISEEEETSEQMITSLPANQKNNLPKNMKKDYEITTRESLENIQDEILLETHNLHQEYGRQERLAASITEQMNLESQELLRLFGIPFLISPTEAEAQCAFLDKTNQTHGTITDDSDIWLFGGKRVYKNFFNQKKQVECFTLTTIANQLGLDRDKMINIALLTGSDYTEGIDNVGTVTAMEILSEFMGNGITCLQKFRSWWEEAQRKISNETKIKAKLRQLELHDSFPNPVVIEGYLSPDVNTSSEPFSWGIPDLDALREFTQNRFGWNKSKCDEILVPILKKMNTRKSQPCIDSFFGMKLKKENEVKSSKRVARAVKVILESSASTPVKKSCLKRNKSQWCSTLNLSESGSSESSESDEPSRHLMKGKDIHKRSGLKILTIPTKKRAVSKK